MQTKGPCKSAVAKGKRGHSKEEGGHVPGMRSPFTGSCTPPQACRLGSWIPDEVEASACGRALGSARAAPILGLTLGYWT